MSVTPVIGSNFQKKLNFSNDNGSGQKSRRIFLNETIYPGKRNCYKRQDLNQEYFFLK